MSSTIKTKRVLTKKKYKKRQEMPKTKHVAKPTP